MQRCLFNTVVQHIIRETQRNRVFYTGNDLCMPIPETVDLIVKGASRENPREKVKGQVNLHETGSFGFFPADYGALNLSIKRTTWSILLYRKQCEIAYPARMTPGPVRSDLGALKLLG
ncbi:UNVERIFIED_CONTAM: hypothetical protein FKN15_070327 [Acipenser sinensis]